MKKIVQAREKEKRKKSGFVICIFNVIEKNLPPETFLGADHLSS